MSKISSVYYDWKENPIAEIKSALKELDIYVYESPAMEGSDMYGLIFSKTKLTKAEIVEYESEEIGIPISE